MLHSLFFTSAKGFYLGADGTLKAKDGYFEGEINATSGTFENVTISKNTVARDLSLSGFKAGDIVLRTLASELAVNNKRVTYYSQICGTGTIRVKWSYKSSDNPSASITIFVMNLSGEKVTKYFKNLEISTSDSTESVTIGSVDVEIEEGESVGVEINADRGGITGGYVFIHSCVICTDSKNGILAYLGARTSTTYTSGAR